MAKLDVFQTMIKGIIYYTDNMIGEPICSVVKEYIMKAGLPVISTSLQPIDFGNNIVVAGKRGYRTMIRQITLALSESTEDYVFFCEQDVLYPVSHFYFVPPRDDVFFYNSNVWRWEFGSDIAVTYDRMLPLSCLCVNREFALDHYEKREKKIEEVGEEAFSSREPALARQWGYEPGTKQKKRGGFSNDDFDVWTSEYPVIDIRHRGTFSSPKCTLDSFRHPPINWKEIPVEQVPGWDLKGIFNL